MTLTDELMGKLSQAMGIAAKRAVLLTQVDAMTSKPKFLVNGAAVSLEEFDYSADIMFAAAKQRCGTHIAARMKEIIDHAKAIDPEHGRGLMHEAAESQGWDIDTMTRMAPPDPKTAPDSAADGESSNQGET